MEAVRRQYAAREMCDNANVERVHSRRPRARRCDFGPFSFFGAGRGSSDATQPAANYPARPGRSDTS